MVVIWLLAFILALAPAGGMLWYIRQMDKYEPEPWKTVGLAFFAGCLSVIPALVGELLLSAWGKGRLGLVPSSFLGTLFSAFVVAGVMEEVSKGALTAALIWRKPDFNEVLDGMVYFGVGHMGFAVTENFKYVFGQENMVMGLKVAFLRSTTAVPMHVICGMIMGYHLGMLRYSKRLGERVRHFLQAFILPILLHGFYDLAALNEATEIRTVSDLIRAGFGTAAFYAAIVALWVILLPRVKAAQEASPWRPLPVSLPASSTICPGCGSVYPEGANYCHMCGTPVAQLEAYGHQVPGD